MGGWLIQCTDKSCGKRTWAGNIVDLIQKHTDEAGWLRCACGERGYVEKKFKLQEPGDTWEPYLMGIIPLGDQEDTYQPFVFLVSYSPHDYDPDQTQTDVWFSYYKDLREDGGRLKLGYGPGGPPVLGTTQMVSLLERLIAMRCLKVEDLRGLLDKNQKKNEATE